jgi:F-type H+-transporting ATPase subunit c
MSPELVTSIYTNTAWVVGIILSAGALATAFAWGIIASKYLESLARQPEMRAQLLGQMLFAGGLMEAFPMIVLGISMWFVTANPFISAAKAAIGG